MTLRNRFIRSGTWERLTTDDGNVTPALQQEMIRLVEGSVGLIITGISTVNPSGSSGPCHIGAWDGKFLSGLSELAKSTKWAGGKIVLQIGHAGCHSKEIPPGETPASPSPFILPTGQSCHAMSEEDIEKAISDFEFSAVLAKKAGFDGIQIHGAHGYLISEFLSPFYNHRNDRYGGNPEKRERFLREILSTIRDSTGSNYPVLLKLNSDDYLPGGFTFSQLTRETKLLLEESIDCVELSGGTPASPVRFWPIRPGRIRSGHEGYYRRAAQMFSEEYSVPLALVGGIRSFEAAERFVKDGVVDFISLSRPLIREPDLIRRWESGDLRPSGCLSCDCCYQRLLENRGYACEILEREKKSNG